MRELRSLFQQTSHVSTRQREPQSIWEGPYFRNLDRYIEEDNLRIQEIIRNTHQEMPHQENRSNNLSIRDEMLSELRRLRDIMLGEQNLPTPQTPQMPRNKEALYQLLDEIGFHVSLVKQTIFIHKPYGMFEINLNTADVHFIPSLCLNCEFKCGIRKRHICIVQNASSSHGYCMIREEGSDTGWKNLALAPIDLLILSKAVALENNLLPYDVIHQIKNTFHCNYSLPSKKTHLQQLKFSMLRDFNQPLEAMEPERPPHPFLAELHAALQNELRILFQRARTRLQRLRENS